MITKTLLRIGPNCEWKIDAAAAAIVTTPTRDNWSKEIWFPWAEAAFGHAALKPFVSGTEKDHEGLEVSAREWKSATNQVAILFADRLMPEITLTTRFTQTIPDRFVHYFLRTSFIVASVSWGSAALHRA